MESFIHGVVPRALVALPTTPTLASAGSYYHAVKPFLQKQFYQLPSKFIAHCTSVSELKDLYVTTNPLVTALWISLALAPVFLVVSEINKNYSQVDRCWSILPTFYNAHYALWAHLVGIPARRLDFVLAFGIIWSTRLTFNYWRKGGYKIGSEDYRWEILREYIPPAVFFIFNVVFISLAQSFLLFLVSSPTYVLLLCGRLQGDVMMLSDYAFFAVLIGLIATTFIADNQQWDFHEAKHSYQKSARVPEDWNPTALDLGFNTSGLFAFSRHPNFAAEQAVWVTLYLWSVSATARSGSIADNFVGTPRGEHLPINEKTWHLLFNYTVGGPLAYLALFQASTWFTELVTGWKYEGYKEYRRKVGKFLPNVSSLWKGGVTAEELILTTGGPARSTRSRGRVSMGKADGKKLLDGPEKASASGSSATTGSGRKRVSETAASSRRKS